MATTQEEGDTLIVQQVSRVEDGIVLVVADDTDIFVLLLYLYHQGSKSCKVLMVSPIQGRSVLDINAAAEEHSSMVTDILAAQGLIGCDTVASYVGVGKAAALKVLRHGQFSQLTGKHRRTTVFGSSGPGHTLHVGLLWSAKM